jgi:MFS family permease
VVLVLHIEPEKQGKAQALFAAVNGLSLILGPIIGAYLTDHYSWHWVFWINVPLGIVAGILIGVFYKDHRVQKKGSVDFAGAVVLALAIAPFMLGLDMGGKEFAWGSWQILTLFAMSIFFTLLFLKIERKAKEPIIAFQLFNKKLVSSTGLGFLQSFVMIAVMVYIPFFVQGVLGGTATDVGKIITHMIVAMIIGTGICGHLLEKVSARSMIFVSVIFMGIGSYMLTQMASQKNLSSEQTKLLSDPNLLMNSNLQSLVPHEVLQVLQGSLSTGIVQVFVVAIGVAVVMFGCSLLVSRERLVASSGHKKIGFH